MKLSEISPVLFRADLFKYSPSISLRPRISLEKSQYVYRFIGVGSGRHDFLLEGERFSISASDVVYLTPGEDYRILPTGSHSAAMTAAVRKVRKVWLLPVKSLL